MLKWIFDSETKTHTVTGKNGRTYTPGKKSLRRVARNGMSWKGNDVTNVRKGSKATITIRRKKKKK